MIRLMMNDPWLIVGIISGIAVVAFGWALLAADEYADRLANIHEQAHAWRLLTRPVLFDWAVECPELSNNLSPERDS